MGKKDVYVAKMKSQLDELNGHLDELEAKARETGGQVQEKVTEAMDRLRADSKQAGAQLDSIMAATESGWHKGVSEMEKLRHAFVSSLHYFRSQV